jgi:hypothetical protein
MALQRRRISRGVVRATLAGLALGTCMLAGPVSAGAAPGSDATVERSEFVFLKQGSIGGTDVVCSPRFALGGGMQAWEGDPGLANNSLGNFTLGYKAADWRVYANAGPSDAALFWTYAICSADTDATVEPHPLVAYPLGPNEEHGAAVSCPSGTRVVGGGVDSSGLGSIDIEVSGPLDSTGLTQNTEDGDVAAYWYSYVRNPTASTVDAYFFAMCSAGSDAVVEAATPPLEFGSYDGEAMCPSGRRAISGGLGVTGMTVNDRLSTSAPVNEAGTRPSSGEIAGGWRVSFKNFAAGPPGYKAFAMCVTDPPPAAVLPPPPAATGARAAALAKCKKKHGKKARKKCRKKAAKLPL